MSLLSATMLACRPQLIMKPGISVMELEITQTSYPTVYNLTPLPLQHGVRVNLRDANTLATHLC
jgi:hypothetical protein